ncbi:MAG: hypothetical protein KF749_07045 [Bacteroidetes bacterium]|nr:hypothetical protein [Bacteroidota bacterium]MCW5896528.1 hypothetical protein [Bacteroidota bacterium]
MLNILQSDVKTPNPDFVKVPRKANEDNIAWLERNLSDEGESVPLVLLGGKNPIDFRLRLAQAHVRSDLTPSSWSHAVLLAKPSKNLETTTIHEISLYPPDGFNYPVPTNAEQQGKLKAYADPEEFPNIAVINVPVNLSDMKEALRRYRNQRAVLDGVELLLMWLAFAWGVGRSGNPLLDGNGIPSAAMIEVVISSLGYELTPGLPSRASCPEAIWQAAKWWHEYYERDKRVGLTGAWSVTHKLIDGDDRMLKRG